MRLFKQLENAKRPKHSKNDMPNDLGLKARFLKECELLIFVFLAIWECRKHIFNMF